MFRIEKKSTQAKARTGRILTPHGEINTPVFMPVGTQGTVKTLTNDELLEIGTEIFIANTYHLYLRPGMDVIKSAGGLHKFVNWQKNIITDSGGYQVFSMATLRKITDSGVEFQSHIDGSKHFLTPENIMDLQAGLCSDIIMCFDECAPFPCTRDYARRSMELTLDWAKRCKIRHNASQSSSRQFLFGIVQGSTYMDLRNESAMKTVELDFDGYALGGIAVGEPMDISLNIVDKITPLLPENKPRYAMGVGTPEDIWNFVHNGIDMFDCVLPTRNGRNGQALTWEGKLNIKNAENKNNMDPLDTRCKCPVCRKYSRAYLHHLFRSGELLSMRLLSLHNLFFMIELMEFIRKSINNDKFIEEKYNFLNNYEK